MYSGGAGHVLILGNLVDFTGDPGSAAEFPLVRHEPDGALWLEQGYIRLRGTRAAVEAAMTTARVLPAQVQDHRGQLVLPGLIDCHLHYPQIGMMASWGAQLLDWLQGFTFPAERAFADPAVAHEAAVFVLQRLLAHGTTTASVFATVHAHSVDAFLGEAARVGARMLCGKVMMDRHAPAELCDTVEQGAHDIADLIARWHGVDRLRYTVTPRFAPTSSEAQLALASVLYRQAQPAGQTARGDQAREVPPLHLQSHLAENAAEIAWVAELYPQRRDYFDVYQVHGLDGPHAIYGHCLHLTDREQAALRQTRTALAFCPTSNLFLGSGVFDITRRLDQGFTVGLATDVGAGSSLSMIRTQAAAYQHSQLAGAPLSPLRAWYLATLGGARALALDAQIGNFDVGKEADIVVLDDGGIAELCRRQARASNLAEHLFALTMLGDERCVAATYLMGKPAHRRA